ncbi:MAG TPA: peptidase T [Candidatus Krumholzibacteria bacterium]|nr:peptidase T [Candidatus Krumholzibacteria bacterium]
MKAPKEALLDRFLRYVKIDTRSDENSSSCPSTAKQWDLLRLLHEELLGLGLKDAGIDENGYVFATVPSNLPPEHAARVPVVGYLAHVDTAPAITGTNVKPHVHKNYQGGDIKLPGTTGQVIKSSEYPNLERMYKGMDIVTTDGTTLLGADDKAGVAEVMTAVDLFLQNPDIPRGVVKVGFTPDEEIGRGADRFDVKRFGANFAYTMDGGPLGEIEYETFNAFGATVSIEGFGVHPGYAKGKLVNAIRIMGDFITRLPREMSPEMTDQRDGYIHPYLMNGQDNAASLRLLLRDFEMDGIEKQKAIIEKVAAEVRKLHPKAKINIEIKESYRNMRYQIDKEPRLVTFAEEAIKRIGVKPRHSIIRGGTDGARLSYMNLPCPNLFAGGEAIHSTQEWVPVQVMEKAAEMIVRLSEIWAERSATKQ